MTTITTGVFDPNQFPPPPPGEIVPSKKGDQLPSGPGVYFVWEGESIAYVGLSKHLNKRATLGHSRIRETDLLSFIEFSEDQLERVEAFYIGVIYPRRNTQGKRYPWWQFGGGY